MAVYTSKEDVVLAGRSDHFGRTRHVVDAPVQLLQLAGRGGPEQRRHGLARVVEEGMRNPARHAHQVARARRSLLAGQQQVNAAVQHEDVLVLVGMHMRRHEGLHREGRMPGKTVVACLLGHIHLAKDVP
jgi:hypothetical protein